MWSIASVFPGFSQKVEPAAIQPALRPITSMIETKSCCPMASWSRADSRTTEQIYLTTLPYPGQWSVVTKSLSIVLELL